MLSVKSLQPTPEQDAAYVSIPWAICSAESRWQYTSDIYIYYYGVTNPTGVKTGNGLLVR